MSHDALLCLSVVVLCFGRVVSAMSTRVNVTAPERGMGGRLVAFVAVLATWTGVVGVGYSIVLLFRG